MGYADFFYNPQILYKLYRIITTLIKRCKHIYLIVIFEPMNSSAKKTRSSRKMIGSVKIKRYLKQFIISHLRLDPDNPIIDLSQDGFLPNLFSMFIVGKTYDENRKLKSREEYNDILVFQVNQYQLSQGRQWLSPSATEALNKLIQKHFHELILTRVLLGVSVGADAKSVILDFLKEYNVEPDEDISLDAIIKASYRLRKSRKIPLFRKSDSPVGETSTFTSVKEDLKEKRLSSQF